MQCPADEGSVQQRISGFVGFGVIAFGYGFEPNRFVVGNVSFHRDVCHGVLVTGTVPVFDVRSDLYYIALFDAARRFASFLIKAFSGQNQKDLTSRVFVPECSAARLKRHVADRAIEYRLGVEHREVGRAREEFAVGIDRPCGNTVSKSFGIGAAERDPAAPLARAAAEANAKCLRVIICVVLEKEVFH